MKRTTAWILTAAILTVCGVPAATSAADAPDVDIWMAAAEGDIQALDRHLTAGTKVSMLGLNSHMVSWDNPDVIQSDEERLQFLTHAVSHHLHDDISGRRYWLFQRYGLIAAISGHISYNSLLLALAFIASKIPEPAGL